MRHTADTIMQVPAFLRAAAPDAIAFVAKQNDAGVAEIAEAYHDGHAKVVEQVGELIYAAAGELAAKVNSDND